MKSIIIGISVLAVTLMGCTSKGYEEVEFISKDGLKVTADFYSTKDNSSPTILMFHQSASSRGEYRQIAPKLQARGFNCLAVDLRWGRQDFWDKVDNKTAQRFGSDTVIDGYVDSDKFRREEVWPGMLGSYLDMEAALEWVKENNLTGKVVVWGSSFSAMLVFKMAKEHGDAVDGVISFSPGEYNAKDSTMLDSWVQETQEPGLIVAGSDSSEYQMTKVVFDALENDKSRHYWVNEGRHGSSVLLASEDNWQPVIQFLHQFKDYEGKDYLGFALEAEQWLKEKAVFRNEKKVWPDAIDEPDKTTLSYSDGMAGKLIYYLELLESTGEAKHLSEAVEIGDYLLDNLPQKTDSLKGKFWAFSAYGEVCGPGFALSALFKITQENKYREAALRVVDLLTHFADNPNDTISWDLGNDVLGGLSGTGLFLLYAAKELNSLSALEMAEKAGKTLIARAKKETNGLSWRRGQNGQYTLPNFSHGPAGIGYFMASLYEVTGDVDFLNTAYKAVVYLDSIAKTDKDVYLIPYGFPNPGWSRDYDIGWAHGPAGVARLFIKLHQITGNQIWIEKAEACYRGIIQSNHLGTPSAGFGTDNFTIDQRFGLAGVAAFFQDLYSYTGNKEYLNQATLTVNHILSKSELSQGLSWPMKRFGFMANAGERTTFTGFFYGSVGFGSLLLNQHNIIEGKSKAFRFVDDPFD